ncbi:hypothetical protein Tco_0730402 [Tanacetum coccineum]|uniref:Uncharacterized protein n=1 Tax=Tanacetum coccineum TaxID=301880 RepID=A0ABQ4YU44_9ASTR
MFFYLITLNLARYLNETAPQVGPPKEGKLSNAQAVQAVEAWKHSDFLCHNYVLNGLVDSFSIETLLRTSKLGVSDVHTLEDPTLILEILLRRFFLRLNLPDHRSSSMDLEPSKLGQMTKPYSSTSFIANCFITGSSKDGDANTSFQQSQVHSHMLILKTQ